MQAGGRRFDSGQLHQFPPCDRISIKKITPGLGYRYTVQKRSLKIEEAAFFVLTKLYGQATKSIQGMPRRRKAMKDVASCVKPRGVAKQTLIRGFPNGETHPGAARISSSEYIGWGSEPREVNHLST